MASSVGSFKASIAQILALFFFKVLNSGTKSCRFWSLTCRNVRLTGLLVCRDPKLQNKVMDPYVGILSPAAGTNLMDDALMLSSVRTLSQHFFQSVKLKNLSLPSYPLLCYLQFLV